MSFPHLKEPFDFEVYIKDRNRILNEAYKKHLAMTEQTAAKKLFDVCKLYQKVRPAMLTIKKIVFFLPKLKGQLTLLIDTLDTICPGNDI